MKLFTTLTILLALIVSTINAQWQSTTLGTGTFQKLEVLNNDTAILTATNSVIYKTTDGGDTWVDRSPSTIPQKTLQTIDFYNSTGIIGVADSFLLVSNDYGDNWSVINLNTIGQVFNGKPHSPSLGSNAKLSTSKALSDQDFITTLSYTGGDGIYYNYLMKSSDGGANWDSVRLESTMGTDIYFNGIGFSTTNNGYIIGTEGTLLETNDGGNTWSPIDLTATIINDKTIHDITIVSKDTIYLSTQGGIAYTNDGFNTFNILFSNESVNDTEIILDSIILAGRVTGNTSRSINNGSTFELAINGINGSILDISVFNDKIYGLSNNGKLYTLSPEQLLNPVANFDATKISSNTISITNESKYAGSYTWNMDDGTIIDNDISGYTFLETGSYNISLSVTNAVSSAIANNTTVSIDSISEYWGTFYEGTNTLSKMISLNNDTAIISNIRSEIFYSYDGGTTFNNASVADSLFGHVSNDLFFLNNSTGFCSYSYRSTSDYTGGFLLRTEDSGLSWNPIDTSSFSDGSSNISTNPSLGVKPNFYSGEAINDTTALITLRWEDLSGNKYGGIYKTTNSGDTWDIISDTLFNNYTSVITSLEINTDELTGYVAGNKLLYKTTDCGNTWSNISSDDFGYICDIVLLNNNAVLLATSNGVFKSTDGFSTYKQLTMDYSADIIAINDSTYIEGKNNATLKFTYDGGETWHYKGEGIPASFFELNLFNDKIYALASGGKKYITLLDNFTIPICNFTYSANLLEVNFTNLSSTNSHYSWDFGDGNFSNEVSPTHTYNMNGRYTVMLTTTYKGNSTTSTQHVTITNVSIDNQQDQLATIYPNPSSNGNFYVSLPNNINDASISILNINGKVIYKQKSLKETNLSITQNLSPGLYIIYIENNSSKTYSKLIVE